MDINNAKIAENELQSQVSEAESKGNNDKLQAVVNSKWQLVILGIFGFFALTQLILTVMSLVKGIVAMVGGKGDFGVRAVNMFDGAMWVEEILSFVLNGVILGVTVVSLLGALRLYQNRDSVLSADVRDMGLLSRILKVVTTFTCLDLVFHALSSIMIVTARFMPGFSPVNPSSRTVALVCDFLGFPKNSMIHNIVAGYEENFANIVAENGDYILVNNLRALTCVLYALVLLALAVLIFIAFNKVSKYFTTVANSADNPMVVIDTKPPIVLLSINGGAYLIYTVVLLGSGMWASGLAMLGFTALFVGLGVYMYNMYKKIA